jgi:hypothetical protein
MFTFLLNSLFGCSHQKTTFPLTPKGRGRTHVTCLDCGKEFDYDWKTMQIGEAVHSPGRTAGAVTVSQ